MAATVLGGSEKSIEEVRMVDGHGRRSAHQLDQ